MARSGKFVDARLMISRAPYIASRRYDAALEPFYESDVPLSTARERTDEFTVALSPDIIIVSVRDNWSACEREPGNPREKNSRPNKIARVIVTGKRLFVAALNELPTRHEARG